MRSIGVEEAEEEKSEFNMSNTIFLAISGNDEDCLMEYSTYFTRNAKNIHSHSSNDKSWTFRLVRSNQFSLFVTNTRAFISTPFRRRSVSKLEIIKTS